MSYKRAFLNSLAIVLTAWALQAQTHTLTEVFHDDHFQITGVTVSKTGRLFVNYLRWSDQYRYAVVEVMKDGSVKPFPNQDWNIWDLKPQSAGQHFVCVQSVVVDDNDTLWAVDAAAPLLASDVPNGPKLVEIDLQSNNVKRVILFGPEIAQSDSYLNDVRIDTKRHTAYLTDSGHPGLVVVDLSTGKAHRALDGHPSVKLEEGTQIVINGKPVIGPNGKPPSFNADGIALSPDGEYLYYQALTAETLYRIKTAALRDNPGSAGSAVETVTKTFPTDGLWMDKKGVLYLSNLNENAVTRLTSDKKLEMVVKDNRLQWPDTFTQGPDGSIYITASHIHHSPTYNQGLSVRKQPYAVFKIN
ncbi:MAG: hypothetical protein JO185_23930 [Acidobacteriaceae bacterium]|nr:hypothetical protein [Acidobacteriaceae bacterium]